MRTFVVGRDVEMDLTLTQLARTVAFAGATLWTMQSAALARDTRTIGIEDDAALQAGAPPEAPARGGGGNVLPPNARPHGYTLESLARAVALFTTTGNNPAFYPDTPFQVLYFDPSTSEFTAVDDTLLLTGSNTFTVCAGTPFYLPLFNVTNGPPIIGAFPPVGASPSTVASYVFGPAQLGLEDVQVVVDGETTSVGPDYLVGPIATPLGDGGTAIITLGVFLSPLSVGTHTISFSGQYAGALIEGALGFPIFRSEFTYTVDVVPRSGC